MEHASYPCIIPVERVPGVPRQHDAVADVPRDPELRAPLGELKVLRARLILRRVV